MKETLSQDCGHKNAITDNLETSMAIIGAIAKPIIVGYDKEIKPVLRTYARHELEMRFGEGLGVNVALYMLFGIPDEKEFAK